MAVRSTPASPPRPTAQAVLIRDDRIAFVGDLSAAKAKAAKDARDVDLKGAAAFPGFVDAHAHLTYIGLRELTLNLDQVGSVEALVAAVKTYAAAHPDGPISAGAGSRPTGPRSASPIAPTSTAPRPAASSCSTGPTATRRSPRRPPWRRRR
jgi:predicted amidohydrolase YtcJ